MSSYSKMILAIVCISFAFLQACSLFEEPEQQTLIALDNEYQISLNQKLIAGPNPLQIVVSTINPPKCEDAFLEVEKYIDGNTLSIMVGNIILPEQCLPTTNILTHGVDFDIAQGEYKLDLSLLETINHTGNLMAMPNHYYLDLVADNGLVLDEKKMHIIPDGLLWGEFFVNDIVDRTLMNTFISELGFQTPTLTWGYYGHFDIGENGITIHNFEDSQEDGFRQQVIFQNHDNQKVRMLVDKYFTLYPQLKVNLITSEGEKF